MYPDRIYFGLKEVPPCLLWGQRDIPFGYMHPYRGMTREEAERRPKQTVEAYWVVF